MWILLAIVNFPPKVTFRRGRRVTCLIRYFWRNFAEVYDVNFGTTKYEHSALRKYFLKTAVPTEVRVDFLGFLVPFSSGPKI